MIRDKKGRFVKGNPGNPNAKGRPRRDTEDKYLQALHSSVTNGDWKAICKKATEQAKSGDKAARQWLSDYLLGKPVQNLIVEGQTDLSIILAWDDGPDFGGNTSESP